MQFNQFNLNENVLHAIENIHFYEPTKIQSLVIPEALKGNDLACKGETGSGKTHAFLIPLANKIVKDEKTLQAIILVPTRELAIQIEQRCRTFFKDFSIKIACLTGGKDRLRELEKMDQTPQILIGTPEKIQQLGIETGALNFSTIHTFIVDEADMTLEMGFLNQVDRIASLIEKNAQIMLFSATIPAGIRQFIRKYFKNPLIIEDKKSQMNEQIEHILYPLRGRDPKIVLKSILNQINPYICLIFLNTKEDVNRYYRYLSVEGIDCEVIHGDLQARERKRNIKRSLNGEFRFIVCSDIAARGIDIEGVSHVISIGFPKNNLNFYIHRAGRCGRNQFNGQCITLYNAEDKESILKLENEGIVFQVKEIKNGEWKELKEIDARSKRKNQNKKPVDEEIKKAIRMNKSKKVKPNHKKKVRLAVEEVKRKRRRQMIQDDIKKQIKKRAIERTKGEK